MRFVLTSCPFCGVGCNFYLKVEDGRVVGVEPSFSHPVSRGRLCVKGWNAFEFIHHPDRLRKPLLKLRDGKFRSISWAQAYDLIIKKIKQIRRKYGADALGVVSSARCTNEENFLIQKFARAVLGTNNVDHCARTCHSPSVAGLGRSFGSGAATNSIDEIPQAKCILVIGSNPLESHPVIGWHIVTAKDKGANIILIDPRATPLANYADLHLSPLPGTDIPLLNAMMQVILKEGLYDKKFVEERTTGFDEFRKNLERYSPGLAERITGVEKEKIIKAARMYAKLKPACIIYGLGITEHVKGTDNVSSLANLAMLTGNVGKPSSGVNPLRGQCNVQGACDMGALPNVYSGYQKVTDEGVRKKFERVWGVKLPAKNGLTNSEMFSSPGRIKFYYIIGEDVIHSEPNSRHVISCLKSAEFVLVEDIFFCQSAEYADLVLPASSFAEKEGTFTNADRRIQRVRQAIPPLPESKPDGEIVQEIAQRLGYPMNYKSSAEVMDEIAQLTPAFKGISYARLEKLGYLQWPCWNKKHPGTRFLHKGKFSQGKGRFFAIRHKDSEELPDDEYPFILSTGRILFHYNTGNQTRRTYILNREFPDNFVEINPEDGKKLGIRNNSLVRVSTRRGALEVRARITRRVTPGVIWMPFHYADKLTNILTLDAFDPISQIGEYKVCAAQVEAVLEGNAR